jgi:hypothetical protein
LSDFLNVSFKLNLAASSFALAAPCLTCSTVLPPVFAKGLTALYKLSKKVKSFSLWFGKIFKSHDLSVSEKIYNGLVRLPLYPSLKKSEQKRIILTSKKFYACISNKKKNYFFPCWLKASFNFWSFKIYFLYLPSLYR